MYVDLDRQPKQNPYYKIDIPADDPDNEWSAGNYFHKDNFILFNLAVGGDFTGLHSASDITSLSDGNNNEASMYVNYVRIYQKGLTSENLDALDPGDSEHSSGITDLRADAGDRIRFDGNNVISSHPAIELYSLSGSKVASTDCGVLSVDSLSPGVYLAHTKASTEKICIR